jgi:predicted acyl esterase
MTDDYEPMSELRDGMRIDWDVRITMSDGVSIAADVFRPGDRDRPVYNGQTSLHSEHRQRPYLLLPLIPAADHVA